MNGDKTTKSDGTFIAAVGILLLALCALMAWAVVSGHSSVPVYDHQKAINTTLVGHNLTYYSIAGKPLNYTIGPGDIQSIEKTSYNGSAAWKVHVGQGLAWDITTSDDGKQILDIKQLFVT